MLHASAAWSRAHLERDPARICADLLASFHETTASDATPDHISAHRWRYAFVEQSLGSAFLWDNGARLGICGDGCLGPRVEAAFESGQALAQAVMETT
jgi:predicted NAD/FAD-dependent oxidoreductase